MKTKKPNSKNLHINTRVTISTVSSIGVAIVISAILVFSFRFFLPSFYNFADVTTENYSLLNQIQWNQAMNGVTQNLVSDENDQTKLASVEDFSNSVAKVGAQLYITKNGEEYFASNSRDKILSTAQGIVDCDLSDSLNYFGENGLVIVSHAQRNGDEYTIVVVSPDYTVKDVSERYTPQDVTSLVFGKTGIIIGIIAFIFILAIATMSLITTRSISKPIKMLSDGAQEIANGNLDYKINYESTNEIGDTIHSINNMTDRLKKYIDERNTIDQSRKEMIAGVAHDLRTPLTSVKGYVEGLRDGIANTPEKQQRYIDTIYSSTIDMEHLLDELLDMSRLELGKIELERTRVDFNSFMFDYIDEIAFSLEKNKFSLDYANKHPEVELPVMLDSDRFSRVLNNIIANSIKYANKEERGKIEISVQEYDRTVIVSVKDNGIGVDPKNLNRIFDTFYRADEARTKAREGSGIGLSVCKDIVELHGGHIWANSKEGEGLTILISLPKILEDNNER